MQPLFPDQRPHGADPVDVAFGTLLHLDGWTIARVPLLRFSTVQRFFVDIAPPSAHDRLLARGLWTSRLAALGWQEGCDLSWLAAQGRSLHPPASWPPAHGT